MQQLGKFEKYLIDEFYDDYRAGLLSRRSFIRRVAFITGSMGAAIAAMSAAGCQPIELPTPTTPMPEPTTPPAQAAAASGVVPGAQSPLSVPTNDPTVVGADVTFMNQGDEIAGYLAQPAEFGVYPAILVCHENRGLTAHIRDMARRFTKEGYAALAVDLLSREGGTDAIDNDQRPGLLTSAGIERHVGDFVAASAYMQEQQFIFADRIGMTGYCFGGGVTWACATEMPELKAAVPYYGPAPDLDKVANIKAAVFGVYAELDERITSGVGPLEEALKAAGVTYKITIYPGANHAFNNDTGQRYVEKEALQAWKDTLDWFAEYV